MPKFFRFPWASTGDKTTIPDETDVAGFVSYQQGYGNDYARDPASDPLAKLIERDKMNQLYSDLTENAQYWQTHAFPEYITAAQNGGVAYAYDIDAIVRYDDGGGYKVYQNQTAGNTNLPTGAGWVEYNIASLINAATLKATPVDSDVLGIADSADSFVLKKLTWANIKTALTALFAPIASPAFTGTPTAPTAAVGTNTTQIATTAFVQSATTSANIQLGTAVTASGTAVAFTGIPAGVNSINVMFDGVSTSGTSNPIIRIGTGGAVSVTGYTATGEQQSAQALYTNGFGIPYNSSANVYRASFVLTRMSGNTWIMSGQIVSTNTPSTGRVVGSITLAGELDIVSATTVNGTDTFDAGTINISWEF